MICKYCGHKNPNDATKCNYCKAAIRPQKNTKRRKEDGIRNLNSRNPGQMGG